VKTKPDKELTTLHIRQFPRALRNKLKAKAAQEGKTLQDIIIALSRRYVRG
jgi:hypothetical protein